jgi:hypothetical protein
MSTTVSVQKIANELAVSLLEDVEFTSIVEFVDNFVDDPNLPLENFQDLCDDVSNYLVEIIKELLVRGKKL